MKSSIISVIKSNLFIFFFLSVSSITVRAQYTDPVKIPISLSANFGELRNNHFHAGLDIKTQSLINKPVYSIADGYISRILVSPAGYGKAIYITHPSTGQVSVYGHLNKFTPKIAEYVKAQQNKQESFRVDLTLDPSAFLVKKGDLIAYSGNSGSSGGPHVHFEIRDAKTENVIDPLSYYKHKIKDNIAPDLRGIAVYPIAGKGVVNDSRNPLRQNISKDKKGQYIAIKNPIYAWGTIGLATKAYDRMTGTSNVYGVKHIRLYADNLLIFKSDINSFAFDESRMLNSLVDFADWRNNKSFFMKSFIEPGNTLPFFESLNNGYIDINEERNYNFRYELEDAYGNRTNFRFSVQGKKQNIPSLKKGSLYMVWDEDNRYLSDTFSLILLRGNLYKDLVFTLNKTSSSLYYSDIFRVNDEPVPFHNRAEMKIKMTSDPLKNKSQYGIVAIKGKTETWVGGNYENGYMTVFIREIGSEYAVSSDTESPVITPVLPAKWIANSKIELRVRDAKSGVSTSRGTIDGEYALFESDVKSSVHSYYFDTSRLKRGQNHTLVFTATDACGNSSQYTTEFYY